MATINVSIGDQIKLPYMLMEIGLKMKFPSLTSTVFVAGYGALAYAGYAQMMPGGVYANYAALGLGAGGLYAHSGF
jgi:uncharacterized membrane protein YfcA